MLISTKLPILVSFKVTWDFLANSFFSKCIGKNLRIFKIDLGIFRLFVEFFAVEYRTINHCF